MKIISQFAVSAIVVVSSLAPALVTAQTLQVRQGAAQSATVQRSAGVNSSVALLPVTPGIGWRQPVGGGYAGAASGGVANNLQQRSFALSTANGSLGWPYRGLSSPSYTPASGGSAYRGEFVTTRLLPQPNLPSVYPTRNKRPETSTYFYGPGFYYPFYCSSKFNYGYDNNVYESAYGPYAGFPSYFYAPYNSVIVASVTPTIFDPTSGRFFVFNDDPFQDFNDVTAVTPGWETLPDGWGLAFAPLGQAWATDNLGLFANYLPSDDQRIAVGLDGRYSYSIDPDDYQAMTRDAMSHLSTSDFRFTDARIASNDDATAYAVHRYRTAAGASGTAYVAYTLRRDPSLAGGYCLVGVNTSSHPLTARQSAYVTRLSANASRR